MNGREEGVRVLGKEVYLRVTKTKRKKERKKKEDGCQVSRNN